MVHHIIIITRKYGFLSHKRPQFMTHVRQILWFHPLEIYTIRDVYYGIYYIKITI